ncbi:MAG TPA: sensor domain-containing diguanylate cyclase [Thermoanaerobaculaceae bacterium]|nr:sensor domain-containing diguanylate cyclase [Thermoanaerobaculaceae bacterium]
MPQQSDFFKTLLDNFYDGVYFVDPDRRITYWNKAAERISGFTREEVVGSHCCDELLIHVNAEGVLLCGGLCPTSATLSDGEVRDVDVFLHHKEGHRVPVRVRVAPVKDGYGSIIGAVEVFTDNTAGMAALQRIKELQEMAYVDPLTGVANRAFTEINLRAKLDEMDRYGWPFGVLFVDIDHFKLVNDNHGHDVGDQALRTVAKTLAGNARSFDLVGRWGGEEFLVALVNVDEARITALGERFRALIGTSRVATGNGNIRITVSIGATLARVGDRVDTLVRRADELMYESKKAGRNRVTFRPPA